MKNLSIPSTCCGLWQEYVQTNWFRLKVFGCSLWIVDDQIDYLEMFELGIEMDKIYLCDIRGFGVSLTILEYMKLPKAGVTVVDFWGVTSGCA